MYTLKTLIFALLTLLMLTNSVYADLPAVRDRLRMPAIMLSPTPEEWVRLHRLSERSPQVLLETLDRYIQACRNGETENNPLAPDSWTYLREYVLDRLGDTAGPEVIPALETFLQRWKTEAGGAGPTVLNELSVRLVMEHIRARQRGRTEYIAEMLRWLKGEYTPVVGQIQIRSVQRQGAPADALEQYLKEMIVGTERAWRVIEAARALGILRVKQAAPLLAEKYHLWKDGWSRLQLPYLVRALAQIGRRPLAVLGDAPLLERRLDASTLSCRLSGARRGRPCMGILAGTHAGYVAGAHGADHSPASGRGRRWFWRQ